MTETAYSVFWTLLLTFLGLRSFLSAVNLLYKQLIVLALVFWLALFFFACFGAIFRALLSGIPLVPSPVSCRGLNKEQMQIKQWTCNYCSPKEKVLTVHKFISHISLFFSLKQTWYLSSVSPRSQWWFTTTDSCPSVLIQHSYRYNSTHALLKVNCLYRGSATSLVFSVNVEKYLY